MKPLRIGFVGVGIMGRGMAANLLRGGHALTLIAHNNRAPVDELVTRGAREVSSYQALAEAADIIILCVTDSAAAGEVINALRPFLRPAMMVIDASTNAPNKTVEFAALLGEAGVVYVEAPVTGGARQAEAGILGGIVGCAEADFARASTVLSCFCKRIERFGEVGTASRAKLIGNYLALGTATIVIETFLRARALGVDWEKIYELAKLGSGDSAALRRILDNALAGDYCGYVFTVENTLKDFSYICDMLEEIQTDENAPPHLAETMRNFYQNAVDKGHGKQLLSELLDPKNP